MGGGDSPFSGDLRLAQTSEFASCFPWESCDWVHGDVGFEFIAYFMSPYYLLGNIIFFIQLDVLIVVRMFT